MNGQNMRLILVILVPGQQGGYLDVDRARKSGLAFG